MSGKPRHNEEHVTQPSAAACRAVAVERKKSGFATGIPLQNRYVEETEPKGEKIFTLKPKADTTAVIVAGGLGLRFGDPRGKQYVDLCDLPLISWSLLAFDAAPSIGRIVIVCAHDKVDEVHEHVLKDLHLTTPVSVCVGGATRQDSSYAGVLAADKHLAYVAVHDAARPLIQVDTIETVLEDLRLHAEADGAIAAAPVSDTLKIEQAKLIQSTPDRTHYWAAQTPQVFLLDTLRRAHAKAAQAHFVGTDDASLIEWSGGVVRLVLSPRDNIKLTVPEDYYMAEALLHRRLMIDSCGDLDPIMPADGEDESTCV